MCLTEKKWSGSIRLIRAEILMICLNVKGSGGVSGSGADPGSPAHANVHSSFLTSRAPSALRSSRPGVPRPLIVVSDSRLRSGFAAVLLPSLLFLAVPCQQNSHLPFFSGPQHYGLPKIKKIKKNTICIPSHVCDAGRGGGAGFVKVPV